MAGFLTGLQNGAGLLVGGQGNAGAASSNAWNYGQYSPFTVNNPMGTTSFNGTTGTSSLSPLQQQIQNSLGSNVLGASQGAGAPGWLQGQYNSIFGNVQGNANTMFNSLQAAQAPWIAQGNSSNLDNEFSKGTLASTAGSYQTAGHDQANNAQMNQNQATAQQFAQQQAANQFGAAANTTGASQGLLSSSLTGLNQQNQNFLQQLQLGGNLGAQRSGANVSAAVPGIETGNMQDNATAGLLSGLLFGGGSQGGLLSSLLGTSGGGGIAGGLGSLGSLLGKGVSSLFGGGGGGNNSSGGIGSGLNLDGGVGSILDQIGNGSNGGGQYVTNQPSGTTTTFDDPSGGNWWEG